MGEIVSDDRVFEPAFLPDALPGRREQLAVLAGALEPVAGDSAAESVEPAATVLAGRPGTGKTCTARYAIRRLASRDGIPVQHVDCWRSDGRFDVLQQVLSGAGLPTYDLHHGSTPHATLMDRLGEGLSERYVVVLDGIGHLDDGGLLYGLNRLPELTLVLVSRDPPAVFSTRDPRLRSRLRAGLTVDFSPYDAHAIVEILRTRADRGLCDDVVTVDQLRRVASAADGDAGWAIRALRTAARFAREGTAETIDDGILRRAIRTTGSGPPRREVDDLPADQRLLVELVREADGIAPGELYERYREVTTDPKTQRTVRSYLSELAADGLISVEGETRRRRYVPSPRRPGRVR